MIVLFGGAAGAGKTTIAHLWCESRTNAVHIQLDEIRNLIVSGLVDPQIQTIIQSTQYTHSVAACTALACSFAKSGYDVAIDDIFEPEPTRELWLPQLSGLDVRLVILRPPLEVILSRATNRQKKVLERHIRSQYATTSSWSPSHIIDSELLTPTETLESIVTVLDTMIIE